MNPDELLSVDASRPSKVHTLKWLAEDLLHTAGELDLLRQNFAGLSPEEADLGTMLLNAASLLSLTAARLEREGEG